MMQILLGSKSPRRHELLKSAGIDFRVVDIQCDEDFQEDMDIEEVAEFLSIKKSKAFQGDLSNKILLTADTTVLLDHIILNKPDDEYHAKQMLKQLSGKMHRVNTGVCFRSNNIFHSFTDITNVYFKELSNEQIEYYVSNFMPLDKAGSYGIQDWIGFVGITRMEGDFYNVMGLPINRVYDFLRNYINIPID